MTDEEMLAKLEAILLEDEEQQMNFSFQFEDCLGDPAIVACRIL